MREVSQSDREILAKEFVRIGKAHNIQIRSCHEGTALERFGVDVSGCMTQSVIERAIDGSLQVPKSKKSVREDCDCLLGNDIGVYNTCGHGCLYCYANYDNETVEQNRSLHRVESPFLIGGYLPEDEIREAKQESYYVGQMSLF